MNLRSGRMAEAASNPSRRRRVEEDDNAGYNQPAQPVNPRGVRGRGRAFAGARAFRAAQAAPNAQPANAPGQAQDADPPEPQPNAMPAFNPSYGNAPQAQFHFAARPNAQPFDFSHLSAALNTVNPSQPSRDAPWRFADISSFNSCINSLKPLTTENWVSFKMEFTLAAESSGVWGFFDGSFPVPTALLMPDKKTEYKKFSKAAFNGLFRSCSESVKMDIKHFSEADNAAYQAWTKCADKFNSASGPKQLGRLMKIQCLRMEQGKADEYITTAKTLRDELAASGAPLTEVIFLSFLLNGLPDSWESVRSNLEMQVGHMTEDWLCTQILNKDQKNNDRNAINDHLFFTQNASYNHPQTAFDSRQSYRGRGRGRGRVNGRGRDTRKYCTHCSRKGHMLSECFKYNQNKPRVSSEHPLPKNPDPHAPERAYVATEIAYVGNDAKYVGDEREWIIDSGCTRHMTPHRHLFTTYCRLIDRIPIMTGSDKVVYAIGQGTIQLTSELNYNINLKHVLFVPGLAANLLSVAVMMRNGGKIETVDNMIVASQTGIPHFYAYERQGLFKARFRTLYHHHAFTAATSRSQEDIHQWHCRLGHPSYTSMMKMAQKGLVHGLSSKLFTTSHLSHLECTHCTEAKLSQTKYEPVEHLKVKERGGLFHTDVCGPVPTSREGFKYFLTITDDATRYKWVYPLRAKSEVAQTIKEWWQYVKTMCGFRPKVLRSDNGGEFTSKELEDFLKSKGMIHQCSIAYHPQQNGVAERTNRTLVEKTRVMLLQAQLPVTLWPFAIRYATWLLNRTYTQALKKAVTPFEAWTGRKPSVKGTHTFGCMAIGYVPKPYRLHKFTNPGKWLLFLGMSERHKGWILVDPYTYKETHVRSAKFHQNMTGKWWKLWKTKFSQPPETNVFEVSEMNNPPMEEDDDVVEVTPSAPTVEPMMTRSKTKGEFSGVIITPDEAKVYTDDIHYAFNTLNLPVDPSTAYEALNGPNSKEWKDAMNKEIQTLTDRGTWVLEELPPGKKPVGVKWVLKVKTQADGSLDKFKARLVAKGFTQIEGQDFTMTFAPVSDYTTARMFLAVCAVKKYHLLQLDVKNAFLYGEMDAHVYMKQPEGYSDGTDRVCKLVKSLYGLKQSPRMWYERLSSALKRHGFHTSDYDDALFINLGLLPPVWCLVYVDDILMMSSSQDNLNICAAKLRSEFEMTVSDEPSQYLGMNVQKNMKTGEITISQEKYVQNMVKRYDVEPPRKTYTPLIPPVEHVNKADKPSMSQYEYQAKVGSLIYAATCSRPDLQFAVNYASQGNTIRSAYLVEKVKGILNYCAHTKSTNLKYGGEDATLGLKGYCDASFGANCRDEDQRSNYGWIFTLGGSAISWEAKRFDHTSLSTTEAEYMACKEATKQVIYLRGLLHSPVCTYAVVHGQ